MLEIPKRQAAPDVNEPKRLFIFSHPKIGKTDNTAQLPNSLIIDLEDGASSYECASFNIRQIAVEKTGGDLLAALMLVKETIISANTEAGKQVFDYIIMDTATALENIAREYANYLYRHSNIGKKFQGGDVVAELEYGAGYEWLRNAFVKIYNSFQSTARIALILNGHVKFSSINKAGKDLQAKDIQLIGKLKQIVCSDADAIGWMYRDAATNSNILSFETNELDLATGARSSHLAGKHFTISQKFELDGITPFKFDPTNKNKKGVIKTYWEEIFPLSIKKQK
jgi:hypothetical protein